jgi:multidrug efflux pump subunit AcrA (membrane-fusion protein)
MTERGNIMLRRLRPFGKVALFLGVIGAGLYWFLFTPTLVVPHVVTEGEIVAEVMGTGALDAHVKATISTKIPGRLLKVLVDQGDHVHSAQESPALMTTT